MSLVFGLGYLLLLVGVGLWSASRTRGPEDFYLAGRKLGPTALTLSVLASIMSGFVFVGGPGLFYEIGLSSFWITISSSFTGALMCWLLARPLFEYSRKKDCLTIPDVLYERYQCRLSSGLAATAIVLGAIVYLATQLRALGAILGSIFSVQVETGIILGSAILVFYSAAGGMLASVYTDVIQGAVMLWTATLVFYFSVTTAGSLSGLLEWVSIDGGLSPWSTIGPVSALSWFFLFAIGSLGQPHVVNRLMMVRDLSTLRFFPLALAGAMLTCGLIWLGGGLGVRAMVASGQMAPPVQADLGIGNFLIEFTPGWLSAAALTGIVAAIMSTADSFITVGAAALSRDFPRSLRRTVRRPVLTARVATLILFLAAVVAAWTLSDLVAFLGILSFALFAAALTPVLAVGLNWERPGRTAARLSLITGVVAVLVFETAKRAEWINLFSPGLVALLLSMIVFIGFAAPVFSRPVRPELGASDRLLAREVR